MRARWRSTMTRADLLAHELFSQVELHRAFGGVVPELASRDHVRRLLPLVKSALARSPPPTPGSCRRRLHGRPGLGRRAADRARRSARSLAYGWQHSGPRRASPRGAPAGAAARARAAAVSARGTAGLRRTHDAHRGAGDRAVTAILGQTRDDAAGEAFDKTREAPGPALSGRPASLRSSPNAAGRGVFKFPRPMLDRPGFEFSFSGLKTAVLHAVRVRELTAAVTRRYRLRRAGCHR